MLGDGVLIGFIPPIAGSDRDDITPEQQAQLIARADYPISGMH